MISDIDNIFVVGERFHRLEKCLWKLVNVIIPSFDARLDKMEKEYCEQISSLRKDLENKDSVSNIRLSNVEADIGYIWDAVSSGVRLDDLKADVSALKERLISICTKEPPQDSLVRDGLEILRHSKYTKAQKCGLEMIKSTAYGQYFCGRAYECGEVISADLNEAVRYYKLSADQGNSEAQERYADSLMYGVMKDKGYFQERSVRSIVFLIGLR